METLKPKGREQIDVLQTLRDHRHQPRILYTAKLSITTDRQRKKFHNKTKFKGTLSTNLSLQKALEGKPQLEEVKHIQGNTRNK